MKTDLSQVLPAIAVAFVLVFATMGQYAFGDQLDDGLSGSATNIRLAQGGAGVTVTYWVSQQGPGCEPATTPVTVTPTDYSASGITASPSSLTFLSCGTSSSNTQTITYSASSSTPADIYSVGFTQSPSGTIGTSLANIDLMVKPPTPSLVSPANAAITSDSTPDLTWSAISSTLVNTPRSFEIEINDDTGTGSAAYPCNSCFSTPVVTGTPAFTDTSFTSTTLPDGTYYWHLRVHQDGSNYGDWSETRSFIVSTGPPPDTTDPTVSSMTVNDALISDSDALADNFQVTVIFSETMKTSVTPTISFSANPGPTLSSPTGAWSTTSYTDDTYTATYNVADAGVEAGPIDVNVGGAQDAAGNPQSPDPTTLNNDLFSIDTKNPTVLISASQSQIAEADVGTGNFDVVATFSESMDTSATPTVDFGGSACAASTLSFNSGAWSTTTFTDDTYTATYDVTDNNDEGGDCDDIDVGVGAAQDVATNAQNPDPTTAADQFSIDTKKPVLTLTDVFKVTTGSQVVTYTQSATDANLVSSPSQPVCTPASGSTFALGDTTVNCTADDTFGNQATGSFKVTLLKVTGFYQPIDMNGVYNKGKAGNTIPFKFNIYGATEITDTSIFNKIQFTGGTCDSGSGSIDPIEVFATGGSSIRYDFTGHQFVYNGATLKTQAGHCYVATLWINGPTVPVATPISALIMLTKT